MPTLLLLMLKGLFTPKQMFIGKIWHDKHFNFYQPVVNASVQAKKIGQSVIFALLVTPTATDVLHTITLGESHKQTI